MKPGNEYELFAYAKFSKLFANADVRADDHISGNESGLARQIDVSIRITLDDGKQLLYIVQCKDWAAPADINTIGELVAVMQDVGASKGFLLCTSGFAKTNHQYARAKGVELVTIEDIQSTKWHTDVQIPIVITQKDVAYSLGLNIEANDELIEANRHHEMVIDLDAATLRAPDLEPVGLAEFVALMAESNSFTGVIGEEVDVAKPGLEIEVAGIWTSLPEVSIQVTAVTPHRYLKYLDPEEYSELKDHVSGSVMPLHWKLADIPLQQDATFIDFGAGDVPVVPGLSFEIENQARVEINAGLSG